MPTEGSGPESEAPGWWAAGLIFENCSCQSICPGHVHFEQYCTYDPCVGYWGIRFDEGEFEPGTGGGAETGTGAATGTGAETGRATISLAGLGAVVAYESPRHMIEGNWTEVLIVDEAADEEQRGAVDGWARLNR